MTQRILVLSLRNIDKTPAMACVIEFEDVIIREFAADIVTFPDLVPSYSAYSTVFCVGLHYGHLFLARHHLRQTRSKGAKVAAFVFDAWNVRDYFYNFRRKIKQRLFPDLSLLNFCDRLFVPFESAQEDFKEPERGIVRYLPIGVDTTLSCGLNRKRPISVFAYGRQVREFDMVFSENLNRRGAGHVYYNTSHMDISGINEFYAHRRLFWRLAENSSIALGFDPLAVRTDVPYSFVGQRWFECLAAGCVVVGKRPAASDVDDLLGWENATIDLPTMPEMALEFIKDLLADGANLTKIRERNVAEMISRHDWKHRVTYILGEMA